MALNARGDMAIAWAARGNPGESPTYRTSVHLVVRTAHGRLIGRRLWSSRRAEADDISVAIDRHGESTVAWVTHTRYQGKTPGATGTIRVAYGPRGGRWARARSIGHGDAVPHLAVAPNGEVLLVWIADGYTGQLAVAWRSSKHRFGRPHALSSPEGFITPYARGAAPAFDVRGSAYVTGECDGVVLRARPHEHRLKPILDRGSVLRLNLSLVGTGTGLASWVGGACTTSEGEGDTLGPVFASVLHAGRFGKPVLLTDRNDKTFETTALAAPGGGGTVAWNYYDDFSRGIDPSGLLGPVRRLIGLRPIAETGAGDQVLQSRYWNAVTPGGLVVRPAGGGPDQPAHVSAGLIAVAAPLGRVVGLAWGTGPGGGGEELAVSVWRP